MINNKKISLLYKTILVTISFIGIYNSILNINASTFAFFTFLSNVLVLIFFLIIWIKTIKDVIIKNQDIGYNKHLLKIKGIATLCITVTGLVYAFTLADYTSKSCYSFQNLTQHYIIPIMVVLDYFLFDEKGHIKWYTPLIWVGCAITYLPYIFIRALILGSNTTLVRYPYFFLDVDKLGVGGVALWCIGLVVFFSLLAYLNYFYDRWYSKKNSCKNN